MNPVRKQTKLPKNPSSSKDSKPEDHKLKISKILSEIHLNCEAIKLSYSKLTIKNPSKNQIFKDFTEVWLEWLKHDIKKFEEDRFMGLELSSFKKISDASKAETLEAFWKGLNIFKGCKDLRWTVRFTEKALNLIVLWDADLLATLMKKLVDFAVGYIAPGKNCEVIEEGPCAHMVYLTTTIKRTDIVILFAILLETTPQVKANKVVGLISHHYLKVVDVLNKNKDPKIAVQIHKNLIKNDPDKWIEPIRDLNGNFIFTKFENSVNFFGNSFYCEPKKFLRIELDSVESGSYCFNEDRKRWESFLDLKNEKIREVDDFQKSIIDRISGKDNGRDFIRFVENVPKLRIKLTEEQENLITSAGNVLAMGRSGTGKTLCSILRLLSTELLFKSSLVDQSKSLKLEDLNRATSLHSVFVTASPVLTNEVKQFYEKIMKNIKEELAENDLKVNNQGKTSSFNKLDQERIEKVEENQEKIEKIEENQEKIEENQEKIKKVEENQEKIEENQENDKKCKVNQIEIDFQSANHDDSSDEEGFQGPSSLELIKDDEFPLFVTARKIIFMIDASMKSPFFMRDKNGQVLGSSLKFQWHNEMRGALIINNEYKISRQARELGEDESPDSSSDSDPDSDSPAQALNPKSKSRRNKPVNIRPCHSWKKKPSLEVDFSIFSSKFFPTIKNRCPFSSQLLWTEIISFIKGSSISYKYPYYFLPQEKYQNLGRKVSMLSNDDKPKVWSFFLEYEKWKTKENAYDMQDVVNYLLNQIHFHGYSGVPIHFMMVDEVQDLSPATLNLFLLVTEKKMFFSGDSAQTIAQGAGFRFSDLSVLFKEAKLEAPGVCRLTVNFRTHNQILALANSVVCILEVLFPAAIDEMIKEVSRYDGPMPCFLMSENVEDLMFLVLGGQDQDTRQHLFGCNQVVIVRDQKSKENLPGILKHALCLTVYEIKGLEFDDVILFNFFADSKVPVNIWNKILNCKKKIIEENEKSENFSMKLESDLLPNNPEISPLCNELKHLYVALTRAKNRLIIFDEDFSLRSSIQHFWKDLNVAEFVTVNRFEKVVKESDGNTFARKTSEDEWKAQGVKMFSLRYFEQAQKCFEIGGDFVLATRAEAYVLAEKATQINDEIEILSNEFLANGEKMNSLMKKERKRKEILALELYKKAGNLFLMVANDPRISEQKVLKQAAKCFASARNFKKAAEIFKTIQLFGHAAESELAGCCFEEAGDMFLLKDEYARAIDAFKLSKSWDKLMNTIYLYKDKMELEERQKYIKKFIPAAFEQLSRKIISSKDQETKYRKDLLIQNKIIPEDSEDSFSDEQESINFDLNPSNHLEPSENSKSLSKPSETKKKSLTASNEIHSPSPDSSIVLLNSENSFSLLSETLEDLDPDDEWLQLETGSILESLESAINPDGSLTCDFSLLDSNENSKIPNSLQNRLKIKNEDETISKFLEYISMFFEDISIMLKSSNLKNFEVFEDFLIEEKSEVELLLDTLEEFGMFRMGLVVCKRYGLVKRAEKFVLSVAFKYSNLPTLTYARFKLNQKEQVQRAVVAFAALNNVFQVIESDSLLSQELFSGLLILGYWKKIAFLLPMTEFLAVSWMFSESKVYVKKICNDDEEPCMFQWLPQQTSEFYLEHLLIGFDLLLNKPLVSVVPKIYSQTWNLLQKISRNEKILESLKNSGENIRKFFKNYKKNNEIEIFDSVIAWSLFMSEIKKQFIFDELFQSSDEIFESFLLTSNLLIKSLTEKGKLFENIFLKHCILAPFGIRLILGSKATSCLPFTSHYAVHLSSPLISSFQKDSLLPIDLEGKTYLASMEETGKVFKTWTMSRISSIIEARRQSASTLNAKINSIGEIWFKDFLNSDLPHSFSTFFDCLRQISPSFESDLASLNERLDELEEVEASDLKYDRIALKKTKKELLLKISSIKKELLSSKHSEKFSLINDLLSFSKFSLELSLKITKTAKLAFLTYAQVFMNSSEKDEESKDKQVWMAFELCRVSDQMPYFIEMLRSRHRLVLRKGKKVSKFSNFYHQAVGLADLHVFFQFRCFDSLAETALALIETFRVEDSLKVYFLQLATISWVFSYSKQVTLPESLTKFNLGSKAVTRTSGKLRLALLEKLGESFSEIVSKSFQERKNLVNDLCDCLAVVIFYIQKDQPVTGLVRKIKNQESFKEGKNLVERHFFFNIVEEFPKVKTKIPGKEFCLGHQEYPEEELEKAWVQENKIIACRLKIANLFRKWREKRKNRQGTGLCDLGFGRVSCLEGVDRYLHELFHCFYRVVLFKSFDMHFLLQEIFRTSKMKDFKDFSHVSEDFFQKKVKRLLEWKDQIRPNNEKLKEKMRKKWNFKWEARRRNKFK